MKMNKLLVLALPLLLAISACDTSGSNVKSSEEESISSSESISSESSESETYSWTEEPIPEKTPEELEQEAWENLANFGELLKTKAYAFDVDGSSIPDRGGIFGPGFRIFSKGHNNGDGFVETSGYIANDYGVLHVCSNSSYKFLKSTNGYALKTNSFDESLAVVESLCDDLEIVANEWTYIGNTSGTSVFKTTSAKVKSYYALIERGDAGASDEYAYIYASISSSGTAVTLNAANETSFLRSSIHIGRFGAPMSDDEDDEECREFFRTIQYKDFTSAETGFDGSYKSIFGFVEDKVPFPLNGNKYYFLDEFDDAKVNTFFNRIKIGFVATGDLTTSYGEQLVNDGWTLVESTTYRLESATLQTNTYFQVDLVYEPAESTTNPDLYTQGIFYINSYRTSM